MNWVNYALFGYIILFLFATLGIAVLRVRQRKDRPPVVFRLRRGPGESLRRRMAKFDEDFLPAGLGWALFPILTTCLPTYLWFKMVTPETWSHLYIWAASGALVFALSVVFAMRRLWAMLERYRSDRLGYLGERFVGEQLECLVGEGFRVFHDVPAEGANKKTFNLDHVVVGPTGVWLIETKTRRKGRARPGFKEHEVVFDGRQLIWPWGEDSHGVEQAANEARWLADWIKTRTNLIVEVRGILTLPGWMVRERTLGKVRVLNTKNVPSAIRGRGIRVLSDEQIQLIALQLDLVCRDVED